MKEVMETLHEEESRGEGHPSTPGDCSREDAYQNVSGSCAVSDEREMVAPSTTGGIISEKGGGRDR